MVGPDKLLILSVAAPMRYISLPASVSYTSISTNLSLRPTHTMSESKPAGAPIELPILDISNPKDPDIGKAMLDAATKYGFLYVDSKGTDFAAEDVLEAFERVRFDLYT